MWSLLDATSLLLFTVVSASAPGRWEHWGSIAAGLRLSREHDGEALHASPPWLRLDGLAGRRSPAGGGRGRVSRPRTNTTPACLAATYLVPGAASLRGRVCGRVSPTPGRPIASGGARDAWPHDAQAERCPTRDVVWTHVENPRIWRMTRLTDGTCIVVRGWMPRHAPMTARAGCTLHEIGSGSQALNDGRTHARPGTSLFRAQAPMGVSSPVG